jgi:hypothetical protein
MRFSTHAATARRLLVALAAAPIVSFAIACSDSNPGAATGPNVASAELASGVTGVATSINSSLAANLCMDVSKSSTEAGTPVIVWDCHVGNNQSFTPQANGEIRVYGSMCLDDKGGEGNNGDQIIIWPCNGGTNQQWTITSDHQIKGINGKCMDVAGANSAPGTRVILWTCSGATNQSWSTDGTTSPTPSPTTTPTDPTPLPTGSREPFGFTKLTDRPFSSVASNAYDYTGAEGWMPSEYTMHGAVITDATAPHSASSVLRLTYPAGYPLNPAGSYTPMTAWLPTPTTTRQIYVSAWLKLSSNWIGHSSQANKLFEVFIDNYAKVVVGVHGAGTAPLYPEVEINAGPDPRLGDYLPQNVTQMAMSRGQWHRLEFVIGTNTPGVRDGVAKIWLDGTLVASYSDIAWSASGWRSLIDQFEISPIWGGVNDQLQTTQYLYFDHVYASVK